MEHKFDDIKIMKLINDSYFCERFRRFTLSKSLSNNLAVHRCRGTIPSRTVLTNFIKEYKILEWDNRPDEEIRAELLSKAT